MPNEVLDAWRKKYPGDYDAVDDRVLAGAIIKKFPGAYDDRLKDVLGPRKIESAAPTPTAAGNNLTPAAPGGGPSPPPGAGGGIMDRVVGAAKGFISDPMKGINDAFTGMAKGFGKAGEAIGSAAQAGGRAITGAVEDIQTLAIKNITGTMASAGHLATDVMLPGKGKAHKALLDLIDSGQKTIDGWTEKYMRTVPPPPQPKIPILDQTPTEAAGMILSGALMPLPGGGATSGPLLARAGNFIKHTAFGTAAFTTLQALPQYLEAKSDEERNKILASLPRAVVGQFLVAVGMFGAQEFHGVVHAAKAEIAAHAAHEEPPAAPPAPPDDPSPRFVAAVTEQNGQVPEVFAKTRNQRIAEAAEAIRKAEAPREAGLAKMREVLEKRVAGEAVESAMPTPEERQARYKEIAKGQTKAKMKERTKAIEEPAVPDLKKAVAAGLFKDEAEARRKLGIEEEKTKFVKAMVDLHTAADEAHADRLIEKGEAETKIALDESTGKNPFPEARARSKRPPGPPRTAYTGPSPNPDTGFTAMMRRWFSPVSVTAQDFQQHWAHMWEAIDAGRWDADRNYDRLLRDIPEKDRRNQAMRYLTGLPFDPGLPPLDGPTSLYIDQHRAIIEHNFDQLRNSGDISANRFRDVLISMYEDRAKARQTLPVIGKKAFFTMPSADFWSIFSDGVKSGLTPATRDMAAMISLIENRMATAAAMQRLKLELKAIPGFAIPAKSLRGGPPPGYTTSKAGHMAGYYIPKDAAIVLDNLFSHSAWDEKQPLVFLSKTQELLKRAAVSISLFHHQAIFRTMLAAGHFDPLGALKGLKEIENNNPVLREGAKRGLQIRGARPDISEIIAREARAVDPNKAQKFIEWWDNKLWGEHVPGAIAITYLDRVSALSKAHQGWTMDEVYTQAVKETNTAFGLQNVERLGRSKTFQDSLRFLMFAPTWTETRLRMFFGAGKEAVNLVGGRGTLADTMYLRQTVGHAIVAGMIGELINLAIGDKKDETTRRFGEFSVPFMKDKRGNSVMIDPLMYLRDPVEFAMHPARVFQNVAKYAMGRRSQFLSWTMDEAANADWKGQKLWRPENTLWQNLKAELGEATSHSVPIFLQHTMDGMNLLEASIGDFKNNAARDAAAVMGFRSRSDYPIDLRLKMESQISRHAAVQSQVRALVQAGDVAGARKLAQNFNDNAKDIEKEIRDAGFIRTLGPWWDKNRRFAYIK